MASIRNDLQQTLRREADWVSATDEQLLEKFTVWREDLRTHQVTLVLILPDALAGVREAARRATGLFAYPCQVEGTLALTRGSVAEIATGEGKTLISAMAACLMALNGRGVHVATVNSYLAERDFEFATHIAKRLGLTVGLIAPNASPSQKMTAYDQDITYGTGYDFGFDYLRDQLKLLERPQGTPTTRLRDAFLGVPEPPRVTAQRGHAHAIVDEIDSVLIDEASSPLVIAQARLPTSQEASAYYLAHELTSSWVENREYRLDRTGRRPMLLPEARDACLSSPRIPWEHLRRPWPEYIVNALAARHGFHRDEHYIVRNDKIVIVDEFTGRAHEERNWQRGLHQALNAKEGLPIQPENETAATITRQRYFPIYETLTGLTGTARESRREFKHFFKLDVLEVPLNRPNRRTDHPTRVFQSHAQMLDAVAEEVATLHARRQPVLIGTRTVKVSEDLGARLQIAQVPFRVLNAREDAAENEIVATAGQPGSVVVATNMAGRGTHIDVPEESQRAGGLFVIGVERSESSRIDRQLAGRCARQGQPGETRFFVSAEDALVTASEPALGERLKRHSAQPNGELPGTLAHDFSLLQARVEMIRFQQRLDLATRDSWVEDTRRNLS